MTPQPPARDAARALECTVCGDFMSEFCSKCGADFAVNKEVATWESFFQYSTLADDESLRVSLGFLRALVLRYRKLETALHRQEGAVDVDDAMVERAARALCERVRADHELNRKNFIVPYDQCDLYTKAMWHDDARAILTAALTTARPAEARE